MNPNTRGAANSLYRSTGRSSQRKTLQDQDIVLSSCYYDSTMQHEGLPSFLYDDMKPLVVRRCQKQSFYENYFLKQKRANAAFEFFMRQRQGMSDSS